MRLEFTLLQRVIAPSPLCSASRPRHGTGPAPPRHKQHYTISGILMPGVGVQARPGLSGDALPPPWVAALGRRCCLVGEPAAVGKLTDREGVVVSLPGGGRGALATDPVPYAFLRVASFPFRTQFTGDDEQFTVGAWGCPGDASRAWASR